MGFSFTFHLETKWNENFSEDEWKICKFPPFSSIIYTLLHRQEFYCGVIDFYSELVSNFTDLKFTNVATQNARATFPNSNKF